MALTRAIVLLIAVLVALAFGFITGRTFEKRATDCMQPGFVRACRAVGNTIYCPGQLAGADLELL